MEAQFLESQTARLAALKLKQERQREQHDYDNEAHCGGRTTLLRDEAESSLEKQWSEWQRRLINFENNNPVGDPTTTTTTTTVLPEEQKRQLRLQFHEMQDILHQQRRLVVSNDDALSDASLQRWHKLLVEAQGKLDKLEAQCLPKGKFVFYRYRQAIMAKNRQEQQQQQQETKLGGNQNQLAMVPEQNVGASSVFDGLCCLQDLSNKSITMDEEKGVQCRSTTDLSGIADDEDGVQTIEFENGGAIPLVWRRLDKCTITWSNTGTTAASSTSTSGDVLYLVNVHDCNLHINVPLSSIHMTDCHNVTMHVTQAQQMRLHKSSDVMVWGRITGGTIIEGCQRIGVTRNCPNVKDFDWLKPGVPSPNLERLTDTYVSEISSSSSSSVAHAAAAATREVINAKTTDEKPKQHLQTSQILPKVIQAADDDSDDEL